MWVRPNLYKHHIYNSLLINCDHNLVKLIKFQVNLKLKMSTDTRILEQSKTELKELFFAGVKSVSPKRIIDSKVKVENGKLYVDNKSFVLKDKVYMIGFGKAVMGMATALERILGHHLEKGIISVPKTAIDTIWESGSKADFPKLTNSKVEYREGAQNNQPDEKSLATTHAIMDLVESLTENDTLIVLISGGGSALLYMPRPLIDPDDKKKLCRSLQNAGADIKELNIVRKKLSMVKGGGLARIAFPASVITLILSDIVGDPVDLIASGPTVYSAKAPKEVIAILKKYELFDTIDGDLKQLVTMKETFNDKPLLTPGKNKEFQHVTNVLLGNNMIAIEAAREQALRMNLTPLILRNDVTGPVHAVSLAYVQVTSLICLALQKALTRDEFFEKMRRDPILSLPGSKVDEIFDLIEDHGSGGIVLIAGGEPTVTVKGKGKGGRNQELALYFSLDWLAKIKSNPRFAEYDVLMLSGGTDGQDGPTDAAGAFGYPAIGPIIHDLYSKLVSTARKEVAKFTAKNRLVMDMKNAVEENKERPVNVTCKTQELSDYITVQKLNRQESISTTSLDDASASSSNEITTPESVKDAVLLSMEVERMLPENVLKQNDSYNFYSRFKKGSDLLKTGLTNTNVMDLHFIYIKKRSCCCEIDFTKDKETTGVWNEHDLHIDPLTIEQYDAMQTKSSVDKELRIRKMSLAVTEKERLNIKIIDENLREPCCNKSRKSST